MYDGINRLVEVRDAYDNVIQQILYNDADAQSDSYDALHNRIQYRYDKNLRQTGMIDAEGNTSTSIYDARGNVVKKKDGNGNTTKYAYDGENHLTKVEDALGNVTSYTYDVNGNLLTQKDGNGNKTTYHYNAANLMTSKSNPEEKGGTAKKESYTYYANGLMASKTDRNGVTTAYTYDVFGRLLTEDAGGEEQSYTYDNNGNLLTMTDATGTTTRTYDELNRNITKTVPEIGTSIYAYDLTAEAEGGYSESTTDPKGNVTLNTYDRVGRLASVTVGDETTTYSYYANGNRKKITYPDQTTESYNYDGNNRIITLTNRKADDSVISSYSYTYDKAGNQLTKQEKKGTTTYTYDELNRLATVSEPDGKVTTYTYDKAGNRSTESVQKGLVGSATAYNYDKLNRLISTVSTGGTYTRYLYDNNGNLISKSSGILKDIKEDAKSIEDLPSFSLIIKKGKDYGTGSKDLTLYTYDKYNRLTKVKNNSSTATYQYNAQGYRTNKTVDGKTTNYLYNGDKVVLETNSSGKQTAFQVYGSALLYRKASGDAYYYLYNAHGDVTALIDGDGTIAATYDYDAFGNVTDKTGNVDNHITYAGYQMDDETGLYYLNARYYDSEIARFITEDSYTGKKDDPLTLNLYTYCHNEPVMYSDPSGNKEYTLTLNGTIITQDLTKKEYSEYKKDGWKTYNGQTLNYQTVTVVGDPETVKVGSKTTTVNNCGNIGTLITGKKGSVIINNGGNISSVTTGAYSATSIYNNGNIGTYNAGLNSDTYITNYGNIGTINNSKRSDIFIDNSGNIGCINNDSKSYCVIGYSKVGTIGTITGGKVDRERTKFQLEVRRNVNRVQFNMRRCGQNLQNHLDNDAFGYLDEQIDNLISLCSMSTYDIVMNTGESIYAWFQRYQRADAYTKTDMVADILAEGIRIEGLNLVGGVLLDSSKLSQILNDTRGMTGTLSNVEARTWYLQQESKIPSMIDKSLSLEQQAKQAFNLRNLFRTQARELMSDRELAESLNKTDPNLTWGQVVKKYSDKGYTGDSLYQEIINSSQRSRSSVNESLGLK